MSGSESSGGATATGRAIGTPSPPDDGSGDNAPRRSAIDTRVADLVSLAIRGLPAAFIPDTAEFAQTVRAVRGRRQIQLVREGNNLRYAAIVALGLATLPRSDQAEVLGSCTLSELVSKVRERANASTDLGAVALAAWAAAEVAESPDLTLLARLAAELLVPVVEPLERP